MSNINLLPEELRKKEDAERSATPKSGAAPLTWREPMLKGPAPAKPPEPPKPTSPSPAKPLTIPHPATHVSVSSQSSLRARFENAWKSLRARFSRTKAVAPGVGSGGGADLSVNLLSRVAGHMNGPLSPTMHIVTVVLMTLGMTLVVILGGWLGVRSLADEREARLARVTASLMEEKKRLTDLTTEMAAIANFSKRLTAVKGILNTHINTSPILQFLERDTLSSVQLTDVALRPEENRVALGALAPDIPSIAAQLVHWAERKDIVASLEVNAVTRQERAEFAGPVYVVSVVLSLSPEALRPSMRASAP